MEITDNIQLLAQQLFQLIQQQNIKITINQQTIRYRNTRKVPKYKSQRKTKNTINKIVLKIKLAMEEPTKQFVGKNNLTIQVRAIYWLYTGFQDRPEILFHSEIDSITVNQMEKMTNTQFKELQNKITQVILEKKVQKILKNSKLELGDLGDLDRAQY
ncbi:hypothetical protein G9A89_009807 [Geosiphon pyriformis]|nr:hypothetical protein G9A89_009807 [Geosiphon pyriformis]